MLEHLDDMYWNTYEGTKSLYYVYYMNYVVYLLDGLTSFEEMNDNSWRF